MKTFVIFAALLGATLISCETTSYVTLKIYNPDQGLPLEFNLSYLSSLIDTSGIQGFAPKEYSIEVNSKDDHVKATVVKVSLVDTNELRVELYYRGEIEDLEKTNYWLKPAVVECDIP